MTKGRIHMISKEEATARFSGDRFAVGQTGIEIEQVGDHTARCAFTIGPQHLNQIGTVMGGAIYTLADFAVAVAANCENDKEASVSLTGTIHYLSVAKGSRLIAEASPIRRGKTISVYSVRVSDDLGTEVAYAVFEDFTKRL